MDQTQVHINPDFLSRNMAAVYHGPITAAERTLRLSFLAQDADGRIVYRLYAARHGLAECAHEFLRFTPDEVRSALRIRKWLPATVAAAREALRVPSMRFVDLLFLPALWFAWTAGLRARGLLRLVLWASRLQPITARLCWRLRFRDLFGY